MTKNDIDKKLKDLIVKAEALKNSYMSKEEFINVINTIDFKFIKEADLNLVTDILDDPEDDSLDVRTKTIRIY